MESEEIVRWVTRGAMVAAGGLFFWLRSQANREHDAVEPDRLWKGRESIYDFIVRHTDPATGSVTEAGLVLPDEADPGARGLQIAPGPIPGIYLRYTFSSEEEHDHYALVRAILRAFKKRSSKNVAALHLLVEGLDLDGMIEPLMNDLVAELKNRRRLDPERIHHLGRGLAQRAPDRDSVKLGMSLMALAATSTEAVNGLRIAKALGKHDEFSIYALVNRAVLIEDHELTIWELAQSTSGWGRVVCIKQLQGTSDPLIKRWLLCEGLESTGMIGHAAWVCAETGDLMSALRRGPDQAEWEGAGRIVEALALGHLELDCGIEDYADGFDAIRLYLGHVTGREATIPVLSTLIGLQQRLGDDDAWPRNSMAPERRRELLERCHGVLAEERWSRLVLDSISNGPADELEHAAAGAYALRIEYWERLFKRVTEQRWGSEYTWTLMAHSHIPERRDRIVSSALEAIARDSVAGGPSSGLATDPPLMDEHHIGAALHYLPDTHEGFWALIQAGLASPAIGTQYKAIGALRRRSRAGWTIEARAALEAARLTADEGVAQEIDSLLSNGVADD